jgi:CO/xanthine dehydrogenase Mo-binding subunit
VDSYAVYTNNIPGGAFRGFGGPQGAFAAENQMNRLAQALGVDPVEIRMRNLLRDGDLLSVGTPLPKGVSIVPVLEKCALEAGWRQAAQGWTKSGENEQPSTGDQSWQAVSPLSRGTGVACAFKNIGFSFGFPEQCWASVELHGGVQIERVVVHHAGADVGQGAHTAMAQMAAEAVGVTVDKVVMRVSDTSHTGNSGSASASRMTFMSGNAIKGAAQLAMEKWRSEDRPAIATFQYRPPRTTPLDPETGRSMPNFSYGYVAQVVEIEVDTETGLLRLVKVISSDDVGKAINPQQIQGQIEGAVVQAAGYAILENFVQQDGYVQTQHLSTYLIPTVLDVPEQVQSLILEFPDPEGPWGARGMAEMPFLPLAPAIVAALQDATGVWFSEFPLTPERILHGLGKI